MILLFLCFKMHLSVVEILDGAHARQAVLGKRSRYGYRSETVKGADLAIGAQACEQGEKRKEEGMARTRNGDLGKEKSVDCQGTVQVLMATNPICTARWKRAGGGGDTALCTSVIR